MMRLNHFFITLGFLVLVLPVNTQAQKKEAKQAYTAYDLMSNYYNNDFKPFKKKNVYIGFAFSLQDRRQDNTSGLLQNVIDGKKLNYNLLFKGGYYIGNYSMAGINFNYYQDKFTGTVFRDPDTLLSNSIARAYEVTPNFRTSIPLTKNERLSFFVEIGLTFGYGTSLNISTKNLDEIQKTYADNFHFRAGLSPGITFFAIESFAFEVQLNVLGYDLLVTRETKNLSIESKEIEHNIDANINLLSLQLGLAYYFGSKR